MFTINRSQKWFLKIRASTITMTAIIATAIIGFAIAIRLCLALFSIIRFRSVLLGFVSFFEENAITTGPGKI